MVAPGGGLHGFPGACMVKGGMHGKGGWTWDARPHEIWPVNARVVRILLECILVSLIS